MPFSVVGGQVQRMFAFPFSFNHSHRPFHWKRKWKGWSPTTRCCPPAVCLAVYLSSYIRMSMASIVCRRLIKLRVSPITVFYSNCICMGMRRGFFMDTLRLSLHLCRTVDQEGRKGGTLQRIVQCKWNIVAKDYRIFKASAAVGRF